MPRKVKPRWGETGAIKEPQAASSKARREYGWNPKHDNGVGVGIVSLRRLAAAALMERRPRKAGHSAGSLRAN
jgi:hypothetical protein